VGSPVKKIIAMLLLVGFLFTGAVGCGEGVKDKKTKDKDAKPAKEKEKDKT